MAPLTAARLIHLDEKCGNGAISKGEKCTKGQGGPAKGKDNFKSAVGRVGRGAVAGAVVAGGFKAGGNLYKWNKNKPQKVKVSVSGGPASLKAGAPPVPKGPTNALPRARSSTGKATPSAAAFKNMKSAKVPSGKAAAVVGGALAVGALAALAMRRKKKAEKDNKGRKEM